VDKVTDFYRTRDEYAELLTVDKFMQSDAYKEWFEEYKKNYDIEITDPAMKAFRLFREKQYNEAGALYEELYKSEKMHTILKWHVRHTNLPRIGRTY